jgi:hypothetical protein
MTMSSASMLNQKGSQAASCALVPSNGPASVARKMYQEARHPAWITRLGSALMGRSRRLLRLSDVQVAHTVCNGHYAGTRPVPIRQIQGSEGRCEDFDAEFRPLRSHNKWRWLSVAKARLQGVTLPPVELVQVGDIYFVRDGHHRISVAKAFGQEDIDAEVTVWEVKGTLSRGQRVPVPRLVAQPA